jgi:hypothetical protein
MATVRKETDREKTTQQEINPTRLDPTEGAPQWTEVGVDVYRTMTEDIKGFPP